MKLKVIKGFRGKYMVSDCGKVFSNKRNNQWTELKLQTNNTGYLQASLATKRNPRYQPLVSHLVLTAFAGKQPTGTTASHVDGNPLNNNITNLVWESLKINISRRIEPTSRPRLTAKEVNQIKDYRAQGIALHKITLLMDRSLTAVSKAASLI